MSLAPDQRLAQYRLVAKIGEGGMGVVWRAVDTTLGREIAIKILPEAVAVDADRLARFEREARVLASLNHPGIATIYGLHADQGIHFLAMELLAGEDLAQRLERGPIPPEAAATIALQVAEALEAAHESGVIHRDLKPANIQVSPDGNAKVLDFGLAKALDPELGSGDASLSPTITSLGTAVGVILGTAAYMSPEQIHGRRVDRRADIWGFGCVLHEMLAGRRPFHGESVSDTLAAVLRVEPEWESLPASTPESLRRLLRRCLQKDPRKRLQAIGEARLALQEYLADPQGTTEASAPAAVAAVPARLRWLPWALTGLLAAVAGAALWRGGALVPRPGPLLRLEVQLAAKGEIPRELGTGVLVSPDGRTLVYLAGEGEKSQLHLRRLDRLDSIPLAGTDGAFGPFFSPDGRSVGFFAGSKLRKVDLDGGTPPLSICDVGSALLARGATWGADGTIVFSPGLETGLMSVPAGGGVPQSLTSLDASRKERTHRWPHFLPDGKSVMYAVQIQSKAYDTGRIDIVSLGTGERKTLVEGGAFPRYASSGHLLYIREGTLQAAPFSPARLEVTGPPRPVLENVLSSTGGQEVSDGSAQYDLSPSGLLAYRIGTPFRGDQEMVWMDREGQRTPVGIKPGAFSSPAISPQGDRVAVAIETGAGTDLWVYEIERGTLSRLTFDGAENSYPVWSADGAEITFSSTRDGGVPNLFRLRTDGTGQTTRLTTSAKPQFPTSLSRDGGTLLLMERDPTGGWDLMQLRTGADSGVTPLVQTTGLEAGGIFSPDGRYIAYVSDETGQFEVFVRPFQGPGGKWQISSGGGGLVRWSPDGRELAYCDGRTVFSVSIEANGDGLRSGKPRRLFDVGFQVDLAGTNFLFAPDGKRFLLLSPPRNQTNSAGASVTLVFGWLDELRRLVPAAGG